MNIMTQKSIIFTLAGLALSTHAQNFAVNYTAQFSWPAGAVSGDVCGLYAQAPTNDWPHYLAAVPWPVTNINFSVTNAVNGYVVPNPANLSVQVQRGTNITLFSASFLLDTNDFPEPFHLAAPSLLNVAPRF
jgi:hypothetical protein